MIDKTQLRLVAMQEALKLLHNDKISIKDGDYDLFNMAENIYNFFVMEGDKFGLKDPNRKQNQPMTIFELLEFLNNNIKPN